MKSFRYDLYQPTAASSGSSEHSGHSTGPVTTSEFLAFDEDYRDGVSLTTGWVAGAEGGAKSIVAGMTGGDGTVHTFSSGSRLDGAPEMYLESPGHHSGPVAFVQTSEFAPFAGGTGVRVATTATTSGADLLVSGPAGEIRKYSLGRPDPAADMLVPTQVGGLPPFPPGAGIPTLGGR